MNLDGVYDIPTMDAYFVDIRDRIQTKLDEVDPNGDFWSLSPLFKWVTSGDVAYGLVLKHLDGGGAPTGREWFIPFAGLQNATTGSDPDVIFQSSAFALQFFRRTNELDGGAPFGNGGIGLHYHTGGLSTTYDLTGVTFDLDTPTTSPGVDMVGFMPDYATVNHMLCPWLFNSHSYINRSKLCMVFNHDVPFVGLYFCDLAEKDGITHLGIVGDLVEPRDPADLRKDGSFCVTVAVNNSDTTLAVSQVFIGYMTPTGVPVIQDVRGLHQQFALHNSPNEFQGETYSDAINLVGVQDTFTEGPSIAKGYLRKDVVAEQGWRNGQHYRMFDSKYGKMLKALDHMTIPWVTSPEPPPFAGWPLDPQDVP
jgi:hypothetical protein